MAGYNILSNSLGSCAASREHTYRNLDRNNFDMSDIDTAIALSSLASTPSKTAPLPLQFPLVSWPGLLPLCLLPPNRFRLLLPPLPPLQKFPRIGARERGGDKTARGVARKPAKWKKKKTPSERDGAQSHDLRQRVAAVRARPAPFGLE